jgi:hypothetical protein
LKAGGGRAVKNLKMRANGERIKMMGNAGRVVYANGSAVSMDYIKGIAARYGINIKGMRSKAEIARAIFSS